MNKCTIKGKMGGNMLEEPPYMTATLYHHTFNNINIYIHYLLPNRSINHFHKVI